VDFATPFGVVTRNETSNSLSVSGPAPHIRLDPAEIETEQICTPFDETGPPHTISIPFQERQPAAAFALVEYLRQLGFQGQLRAIGHDLEPYCSRLFRAGFDEVEIASHSSQADGSRTASDSSAALGSATLPSNNATRTEMNASEYDVEVTEVQHYTDTLFRFRVTRPPTFRFRSGEFVMIGLPQPVRPLFRAYSIASPAWAEHLEFYSVKVPDGPLTQRLKRIQPGDSILLKKKPTGTLVLDALTPAKTLYLLSTGTGIAPFASLSRDPETYEKFDRLVLTHTCRHDADLIYGKQLEDNLLRDPLVGELAKDRFVRFSSSTRERACRGARITDLISSGALCEVLGLPPLDRARDRVMICGSMSMVRDTKGILIARGFEEGSNATPADFVVESAFVD